MLRGKARKQFEIVRKKELHIKTGFKERFENAMQVFRGGKMRYRGVLVHLNLRGH